MAPRNVYPACRRYRRAVPRAPREIHISDSAAYFTGVAKNDRISVGSFLFLSRSLPSSGFRPRNSEMHHTLCAMRHAPCLLFHWGALHLLPQAQRSSSPALRDAPQVYPVKCAAYFTGAERSLCLIKLVLRLDVGRWNRILRVWEIVKNRDLTPNDQ